MKKLLMMLVVLFGTMTAGCTMTETMGERHRRIFNIWELQMRMAVEDFDYLMLVEKVQGTSPWHIRKGLPN